MSEKKQPMPEKNQPILDKKALKLVEENVNVVRKEISSLTDPIRRGAELTENDYSIRINARD